MKTDPRNRIPADLRESMKAFEAEQGRLPSGPFRLLTIGNTKTLKGEKKGYRTYIMHLSPADVSGRNVCAFASKGCKAACLNTAGRGRFDSIQNARLQRTLFLFADRPAFLALLRHEIERAIREAASENLQAVFRLNGTSDLPWENFGIPQEYPNSQFYDYTKNFHRMVKFVAGDLPTNYHLTFSRSEENEPESKTVLKAGGTVAVVFADSLPVSWNGYAVADADETDLRFLDSPGTVAGLSIKGEAATDRSGFVVR